MAGVIKGMLDAIIAGRANGNPVLIQTTKTKLMLKGIDPEKYTATSTDDPAVVAKLQQIAAEMNITLRR